MPMRKLLLTPPAMCFAFPAISAAERSNDSDMNGLLVFIVVGRFSLFRQRKAGKLTNPRRPGKLCKKGAKNATTDYRAAGRRAAQSFARLGGRLFPAQRSELDNPHPATGKTRSRQT